jgi:hypothetical protein
MAPVELSVVPGTLTPNHLGNLDAWLTDVAEGEVAAAVGRLGDLTISGRAIVAALTDWLDRMVASGVGQRAVVAALAASLARRGIRLAYQTFRNYRCQTSRLLGAGARERVALVAGVDHQHLRAAPGAVGRDGKRPVAAAALERALARSGVCGETPAPGMLSRVLDRLKPIQAMASSRLSLLARVSRSIAPKVAADAPRVDERDRAGVAFGIERAVTVEAPSAVLPKAVQPVPGWRPPPPLKPATVRAPDPGAEARNTARRELDEQLDRAHEVLMRGRNLVSSAQADAETGGEKR